MPESLSPMTESIGHERLRRKGAHAPSGTADARSAPVATRAVVDGGRAAREDRTSRAVVMSAIGAVVVLVLLMPTTPMVGILLIAAVSLGVVAVLVARGEDRRSTGESLERLGTKGYLVLADRVAPGLTGTIGHLVIGPGGVFVVETRDQTGRIRIRGDQLVVGRLSHSVGGQLRAQVAAVATALGPILDGTGAGVVPLICMRYAEMPLLNRTVAGIPLLRESQLARRISRSTPVLDGSTVSRLGELAELAMPRSQHGRGALHGVYAAEPLDAQRGLDTPKDDPDDVPWSLEPSDHAPEPVALSNGGLALPSARS